MTDHTAVKAILETPNPSGKHARWWTKVYGTGLKDVKIVYRAGRLNSSADALSRSPHGAAPPEGVAESEVQVASLQSDPYPEPDTRQQADGEISDLLTEPPRLAEIEDFGAEQREDPDVKEIIDFIEQGTLPSDDKKARRIAMQKSMFAVENGMLFYLDPRQEYRKRAVVPKCLRGQLLLEHHSSQKSSFPSPPQDNWLQNRSGRLKQDIRDHMTNRAMLQTTS